MWEGAEWRCLMSKFHKGPKCGIKVESWDPGDDDDNTTIIIDCTGTIVYCVCDSVVGHSPSDASELSYSKPQSLGKNSSGHFTSKAKSKVSTSNPPTSKSRKGRKAQPKSTEVISGDDADNDTPFG